MAIVGPISYNHLMPNNPNSWFHDCISALTYSRHQRVWSIIVSLFGDLARADGDQISGAVMSRIIEPVGIKPEAIRVALHRLRNDGWITSQKSGRSSRYRLTKSGLAQSEAASPRIYARSHPAAIEWQVIVLPPMATAARVKAERAMISCGFVMITSGVLFAKSQITVGDLDALVLKGTDFTVPNWLRSQIGTGSLGAAYKNLETALDTVSRALGTASGISPMETATLRTLIVHNWRRVLLLHADLPPEFFPTDWRGFACQQKVVALLDQLQRPQIEQLEI